MLKKLKNKIHILQNIYLKNKYFIKKTSYAMDGEDLAIDKYIEKKEKGFYVDIGAHHPIHRNNTQLLFNRGWGGINIDVNQFSIDLFNFLRPDDVNINSAITNYDGEIKYYYQKELSQLTSVKKEIAIKRMQGEIKEKKIKSLKIDTILNYSKFKNNRIDFLNIDVEGGDFDALRSIDLNVYKPKMICIEIDEKNILSSNIYSYLIKFNYKKVWSSSSNLTHIFTKK